MSAVLRKTLADIRRRQVQTAVVAFVTFLSSLAAVLALTLLVESDAPFDRAFARVQGPHLTMLFEAPAVTEVQVRATGSVPEVSAFGGPWRVTPASIVLPVTAPMPVAGRADPGGAVDRLSIEAGRFVQGLGEVVISRRLADEQRLQVGDTVTPSAGSGLPPLRIVGVASAVGDDTAAWVLPAQLPAVTAGTIPTLYLMAYRLHQAATPAQIAAAVDAITARVPGDAVVNTANYLDVKINADRTTAVMIPFLLAFSAFALLASALIIANLVGGAVIAGTREIGIMKSVGFTPAQVVLSFSGQMGIPAAAGAALGLPAGVLLSQPFLSDTAHAFGLPRTFDLAPGVDLLGLGAILLVVVVTTVLASLRAGRLSAAASIAAGSAPTDSGGAGLARQAARLPLPRALTLGLGESLARPVRSAMTIIAIIIGVATVTFALGLHDSLTMVASALSRDRQVQVEVFRAGVGKGGPGEATDQQAVAAIAAQPGTARFVAEGHGDMTVVGAGHPVPVTGYRGDSSWLGYVLIHGRWFHAPGEAVAPTAFFTRTGHHVGDHITAAFYGQPLSLTLVGEIFDQQGDDILLRTALESLPAGVVAWNYEVQLRPGQDATAYIGALRSSTPGLDASNRSRSGIDTAFLLINSVLAGLALVLTLIAISGVFNTVVLNTREKARDTAILKALGMTPGQVTRMVLASVLVLGLLGAGLGIVAGEALHRDIITVMGQIATATAIPDPFFHVFPPGSVAGIAVAGVLLAMLGAALPAQWAARASVTEVLQTE